jgi:acetolactate synthase-1/2/3 large subunit
VLEAETTRVDIRPQHWRPVSPAALPSEAARAIASSLLEARRPLAVTSFVGRNPAAVDALVVLCRELAVGVVESVPNYVNFPTTDPCYLGCQWNEPQQNAALAEADRIVVFDSDVPWIPAIASAGRCAHRAHDRTAETAHRLVPAR